LYLLFDDENWVHDRPFVFTTEAHPFLLTPQTRPPLMAEAAAEVVAEAAAEVVAEAAEQDECAASEEGAGGEDDEEAASPEDKAWRIEARRLVLRAAAAAEPQGSAKGAVAWPPPSLRAPAAEPVGARTLQSVRPHWLAELGFDAAHADALDHDRVRRPAGADHTQGTLSTSPHRYGHAFNDLPWHATSAHPAVPRPDEEAPPEQHHKEAQSTWADAPKAETGGTTLSMGDLGTFRVSVFTDG
jgi:hypothetical protein